MRQKLFTSSFRSKPACTFQSHTERTMELFPGLFGLGKRAGCRGVSKGWRCAYMGRGESRDEGEDGHRY